MHSGTTFTESLLNRSSRGFHHVHNPLDPTTLAKMRAADVIVVPLRDPQRVWESFCLRGHTETFYQYSFYRLTQLSLLFRVLYLPIDKEGYRSMQLDLLSEILLTKLYTDWIPSGTFPGPRPEVHPAMDLLPILPFYS